MLGAGLGRTGTNSLKLALEELLDGPCYHMFELMQRLADAPTWDRAMQGQPVDWTALYDGYAATVDWPGCVFWRELRAAYPDAMVLLSTRDSAQTWWASMERTIVPLLSGPPPSEDADIKHGHAQLVELFRTRLTPRWWDRDEAIAAYERHNDEVRREVPSGKLIEWETGDGWEPICAGLGLAVPSAPFPNENSADTFATNVARALQA